MILRWSKLLRFHVLEVLIKEHGLVTGVEVGVYKGETFGYLLDHCPELTLYGVDIEITPEARAVRERHDGRAYLIGAASVEAAWSFADGAFDFVFIDADHAYLMVKADIDAWMPKVHAGGILCGHDYGEKWPGVVRAVNDAFLGAVTEPTILPDKVWMVHL